MESQVPKTMKEEQDSGSPHDPGVVDFKFEPVDEDLKDLDCSEYVMKNDIVETEALVDPLSVPIKFELDFERMAEVTIKEDNLDTILTTEDMKRTGCVVKGEVDDAEALIDPLFVPVESELYCEEAPVERPMEENFEAAENEDIQGSCNKTNRWPRMECSLEATSTGIAVGMSTQGHSSENPTSEHSTLLLQNVQCQTPCVVAPCCVDERLEEQVVGKIQSERVEREMQKSASLRCSSEKSEMGCREKSFECSTCEKRFLRKGALNIHMRVHTGERPFKCSECEKSFCRSDRLTTHMRIHSGERPYKCSLCGKTFSWRNNLTDHMHSHTDKRPYKCSYCGKSFHRTSHLNMHRRIHIGEMPYKCSQCEKSFCRNGDLKVHMRYHTDERPYKCSQCNKSFHRSSDLTNHMRIHSGEKPYKCSQCEKSFYVCGDLSKHMRYHTDERPYKCNQCNKSFHRSSDLTNHKRIHTGEKPYKCSQCNKSFYMCGDLTKHMRFHTGERPYKCSQCNRSFHISSDLTKHMRTHK